MNDLGIIDQFLATFTAYIDSGFGLLAADVAFLTAIIISIDIVLAGLFWAMGPDNNIVAGFLKKVLYVGFFALVLNNFAFLAEVIFTSFAQLGLNATGGAITAADLLRPGFIADTGFTAGHPLLNEISSLTGPVGFFTNFVMISILFLAWLITLFAFFFLAIQLFVTIIEFKLTTLAGFVLVPFALWNKTSFLAERVLGNVISSGVKLMVLAVIVGIGSTLFGAITSEITPGNVSLEDAATVILASLSLLALGIFGPGIATGLVSGAPQLGAGAVVGTSAAVGAGALAGGVIAAGGVRAIGGATGGAVKAGASMAGGAQTAFQLGINGTGSPMARFGSGICSVAQTAMKTGGSALQSFVSGPVDSARASIGGAYQSGVDAAFDARRSSPTVMASKPVADATTNAASGAPAWARSAQRDQLTRDAGLAASSTIRDGDGGGSGASPELKQEEGR